MGEKDDLIQYLTRIVPGATVECAGCPAVREIGEMVERDGKFYHSEECADRANAVLRKKQPKGVKAGCFDV